MNRTYNINDNLLENCACLIRHLMTKSERYRNDRIRTKMWNYYFKKRNQMI